MNMHHHASCPIAAAMLFLCAAAAIAAALTFTQSVDMNGNAITNAAAPTAGSPVSQVATKGYVDVLIQRLNVADGLLQRANEAVLILAGYFAMGTAFADGGAGELPVHTNFISSFYMDKCEVSYTLWSNVYQWAVANGYSFTNAGSGKAANHPAQTLNWYDCVKWCNARSEMQGLTPCYYTNAAQTVVYRGGQENLPNEWVKWTANGYRLPTEAEWEKAARGGAVGMRFPWPDANTITNSRANYNGFPSVFAYDLGPAGYNPLFTSSGFPYTSPVGYFAPNGYGLYDMVGNVFEWCWDWYLNTYYSTSTGSDPRGPAGGAYRVLRGGYWDDYANLCRVAFRSYGTPGNASYSFGFRCVRGL